MSTETKHASIIPAIDNDSDKNEKKRLLLVDDNPENLHLLIQNLQNQYEVICANSGETALECTFSGKLPDLVLLDIMMPGMNGFEVCSRLKANSVTKDIPIIFVTALGQEVDEAKGLEFGAVDFITKPFSITIVKARINAALRLKEEMDQRISLTRKLETLNSELECRVREKTAALTKAHEKLQESEKKYRSICENAVEGFFQTSFDGRILDANQSMARILGYASSEELIQSVTDIRQQLYVHPESRDTLLRMLEKSSEDAVVGHELQYYRKDKQIVWVALSSRVVRDNAGKPLFLEGFLIDITERKRAEENIFEINDRFMSILRAATAYSIIGTDLQGIIKIFNVGAEMMLGYGADEVIDKKTPELFHDREEIIGFAEEMGTSPGFETLVSRARQGETDTREWTYIRKDQTRITVLLSITAMQNDGGGLSGFIGLARDITNEKKLEQQLIQSQKMESVGLLAGGIAHDFNNMLTPILGYTDVLLRDFSKEDPRFKKLQKVKQAAVSASYLTRHLLAFSRKQIIEPKNVNLGDILCQFEDMLHRTIRENITIGIKISPSLGQVCVDAGQIEQLLLNLSINAQDAMPKGGTLEIEVNNMDLDELETADSLDLTPGRYVMLSVKDSGSGMDNDVMEHIFEPFFTTKEVGKGTGLGLSTVYGIVKQHGGSIVVNSKRERGTIFKIFFPRIENGQAINNHQFSLPDAVSKGGETILLVEDDEMVRILTYEILSKLGYRVIVADTVAHCFELVEKEQASIDLLLTDVVMPTMNGKELYDLIRHSQPGLKVLFMSGHTSSVIQNYGVFEEKENFIQKPFTIHTLSEKVRTAMSG